LFLDKFESPKGLKKELQSYYSSNTSDDTAGSGPVRRILEEILKILKFVSGSSMLGFIEPLILVSNKSLIISTLLAGFPREINDRVGKTHSASMVGERASGNVPVKAFPHKIKSRILGKVYNPTGISPANPERLMRL
jgi:hypothetical protein